MNGADTTETRAVRLEDTELGRPGITVLAGHAGVGKTNLALNLALALTRASGESGEAVGRDVTLADLDLVNPYFRSSDYVDALASAGVQMVAPTFARTGLDTPSVGGELRGAIERAGAGERTGKAGELKSTGENEAPAGAIEARTSSGAANPGTPPSARTPSGTAGPDVLPRLVIDVGGDDGAVALGRYAAELERGRTRLYYVVNAFRNLTATPEEALEVLAEVERSSRLAACGVVNCSNLAGETTWEHVERGRAFARAVAAHAGLPLVLTVVPEALAGEKPAGGTLRTAAAGSPACETATGESTDAPEPLAFVRRLVLPPWEKA